MNFRRLSTFSPISVEKISSAACGVVKAHPEQRARFRIHRGFPELVGIHFAQAFEPRDREIFFGVFQDVGEHVRRFFLHDLVAVAGHRERRMIEFTDQIGRGAQALVKLGASRQMPS